MERGLQGMFCLCKLRSQICALLFVELQLRLQLTDVAVFLAVIFFYLGEGLGRLLAVVELLLELANCFLVCLVLLL